MKPKYLYKYQPFSIESLVNLKNREIWFSMPAKFNDPYDCAIEIGTSPISEEECYKLFKKYREKKKDQIIYDLDYLTNGKPNEKFKEKVQNGLLNAFKDRKKTMLYDRGVACFSEINNNLLMWSHYANGHRGFCLKFDTRFEPFKTNVKKIQYRNYVPSVSPANVLMGNVEKVMMPMITIKSSQWSYEKEWRLFHLEANKAFGIGIECLKAIYLGSAMEFTHKEIIAMILRDSPTKLYNTILDQNNFQISFEKVNYTPFNYKKKKGSVF